eukprot:TRINITY_DN15866_c0_g1_i1.p1 TRINITY_DN15866_c0_g1~~TRINITY_DN15866_c0_g1_i1.p1  ORF type:complete len:332 (+),score=46.22 TRINITY_DN15866_c0_g1_i1:125-1120(+)
MKVISGKREMLDWSRSQRKLGKRISLVPTMGFLHEGHLSLIREAQQRSDVVVVSIFVNPTQFAPHEDLATYPRDNEGDMAKLELLCVDAVFLPSDLYDGGLGNGAKPQTPDGSTSETQSSSKNVDPSDSSLKFSPSSSSDPSRQTSCRLHQTWVEVADLQKRLEGTTRPHFFRGVATVVSKLLHLVDPDVAVFGRKDYQQWRVLTQMVKDLDFPVEVVGAPLVREADGLAMSSRNVYLTAEQRRQALSISRGLFAAQAALAGGELQAAILRNAVDCGIREAGARVDYVELVDVETLEPVASVTHPSVLLIAAYVGKVRLIDNLEVFPPALA